MKLSRTTVARHPCHLGDGDHTRCGAASLIDEQRLGPYRFWHHQHHFAEIDGGTQVREVVHYALPLDPAVRILHRWLVKSQLERIFDYRRDVLHELFGALPQA